MHGIQVGVGWRKDKSFSFIYFPSPKFSLLHLGSKPQKAFSYMFGLSHMMPPEHKSAPAARKFPLHALFLSHWSHPRELLLKREGSRPSSIFSVTLATAFPSIWMSHQREILPPLRFNTSLTTSGEVSQPQPQRLENISLRTSLLKLWSIQLSHKENQENMA